MGSSANFRTVLSESRRRQPIAESETDFNAKWPFKVIYFGTIEEPLMGYIVQYNKCGLRCEGSEDIASEKSENLNFRPPCSALSFDAPSPANHREYPHKTYLAIETIGSLGYIFVADSMGLSSCKF